MIAIADICDFAFDAEIEKYTIEELVTLIGASVMIRQNAATEVKRRLGK